MPVSRQPAFWDWRGGRRPGRAGQPRLMRKCHWELSVFFCFSLQRAPFVPSLSPADPNPNPPGSLLLHNTGSGRSASGFLPVHLIPRESAPPFPNSLEEGGREGGRTGARERPTGGSSDEVSSQELQVPSQDLLSLSSEAGLRTKHPAAMSLSRPAGGDFSELHPPNCEMGAIARSEDCGERAQMKPGGGRLQPESLREKFG